MLYCNIPEEVALWVDLASVVHVAENRALGDGGVIVSLQDPQAEHGGS